MKRFTIALIFFMTTSSLAFSQIKRAYVAEDAMATTVVVKEDQADDLSILMGQFDMSAVSMGEQVRITTGIWELPAVSASHEEENVQALDGVETDFTANMPEEKAISDDLEIPQAETRASDQMVRAMDMKRVRKRSKVKFKRPFKLFGGKKGYRSGKCPKL